MPLARREEGNNLPAIMDEFDDGLEAAAEETSSSRLPMIALWIGLVGIVVGATGIILANQAQRSLTTLEASLSAQPPDKTPELEAAIDSLEERLERLGSEFVKLTRQDTQIREAVQAGFDQVQRNVRENRSGINDLSERLEEMVEQLETRLARTSRAPVEASRPTDSGVEETSEEESESLPAAEGAGIHYIESGDTFSKIAKQYGVSLGQIQRANPTVDPRRLQIGQEIVIPAP